MPSRHNGSFWFDRRCDDQLLLPQSHALDKRGERDYALLHGWHLLDRRVSATDMGPVKGGGPAPPHRSPAKLTQGLLPTPSAVPQMVPPISRPALDLGLTP
jgi:hypothetical protein